MFMHIFYSRTSKSLNVFTRLKTKTDTPLQQHSASSSSPPCSLPKKHQQTKPLALIQRKKKNKKQNSASEVFVLAQCS